MPKDQSKKNQVKKSAKSRAPDKNEETLQEIIRDLTLEFQQKKKFFGSEATADDLKNNEIFLGKVQIAHMVFQVQLVDGRIVQVQTHGNIALHDMIKQAANGTREIQELQPYILIRFPPGQKCGETLALVTGTPEITKERFAKLENAGILVPKKDNDEFFEKEEEIKIGDL
jgi:hypothetical protein